MNEGRALLTTTPYNLGWLHQVIWRPWKDAKDAGEDHPYIDVINFESTANPAFSRAEFDRLRETMPGWKFDLFHRGIFTRPAGLIYGNFTDDMVVPPFPIPDHWPRYLGVDFSGVNTVGLFTAVELDDNDQATGRLIHYREYWEGDRSAAQHAEAMLGCEPQVPVAYGGAPSEDQWRREFGEAGLVIFRPPVGDVEVGIDRVYAAHQRAEIVVFETLVYYLEQKRTYRRPVDAWGNVLPGIVDKQRFHLLDAERYIVSHLRAAPLVVEIW